MRDGGCLVFVEVRYRSSERWGGGAASITPAKRRRLVRTARSYLRGNPEATHLPCRFDVFAVGGSREAPDGRWIRDAFPAC